MEPHRLQLLPIIGGWRAVDVLYMTEEPYLQALPAHTIKGYPYITTETGLTVGAPKDLPPEEDKRIGWHTCTDGFVFTP